MSKLDKPIGYKVCDSDLFDDELSDQGIEMIAPHKRNRVKPAA